MNRVSAQSRPGYFWPLIALVVGLLIGWLVIGWGVWPVRWTNALPQDLRAAERDQYLAMVAESYAATGDMALAQNRLVGWSPAQLAELLGNLQTRFEATDARQAGNVQVLGQALGLGSLQGPTVPAGGVAPTTPSSQLKTICTAVLWAGLVLAGIVGLVWLWQWWKRRSQPDAGGLAIGDSLRSILRSPGSARSADDIAQDAKRRWPQPQAPAEAPSPTFDFAEPAPAAAAPVYAAPIQRGTVAAPSASVEPPRRSASAGLGAPIGDNIAIFQLGEPDYDEGFDINDPVDGYLGQCGLQLFEPLGRSRDQAVALHVWLWDARDTDTHTSVLMSEGAYRDPMMRSAQASGHDAIPVRPGQEFELVSHNLALRGRVEQIEYTDQEPAHTYFSELQVRLQIYRKS